MNRSFSMEKALSAYTLAAAAAGVSLSALTTPSEAKIIYTSGKTRIPINQPFSLDVNNDHNPDFTILDRTYKGSGSSHIAVLRLDLNGNAVWGRGSFVYPPHGSVKGVFASDLPRGFKIHASKRYFLPVKSAAMGFSFSGPDSNYIYTTQGQWVESKKRYLGLKFMINGKEHYGWARFDVLLKRNLHVIEATLTGYAYETIPNKPIIAGRIKGADVVTMQTDTAPGNLGSLALGRK